MKHSKLYDALFLAPGFLIYIIFMIVPVVMCFLYSFTNWDGIRASADFVGISNFLKVFKDAKYWTSMWFTLRFTFFVTVFTNVIGFLWAYGLSNNVPFRNFMRAGFYMPKIVGGVTAKSPISGWGINNMNMALTLNGVNYIQFDEDVCIEGYVSYGDTSPKPDATADGSASQEIDSP